MNLRCQHDLSLPTTLLGLALSLFGTSPAFARQEGPLEQRVSELESTVNVLLEELERRDMPGLIGPLGESRHGLGPAASKVYAIGAGVSIGGYGEFLFSDPSGPGKTFDAYRSILYTGFKFDEHWLFNSELEVEHASTEAEDADGETIGAVALEFAYIDYLHDEHFGVRAGLVLVPLGIVNELHEPTTFLPANRPETEKRIIPTTWSENGVGLFGETDAGLSWKVFAVAGLDGNDFSAAGLRGGRQKGAESEAEDFGFAGRLDYVGQSGLTVGGSVYLGDSGQGGPAALGTTIAELHAIYTSGPWSVRALAARAEVEQVEQLNAGAAGVAEGMHGHYLELGYDLFAGVLPVANQSLTPFVRYEEIDTQADLPAGQVRAAGQDDTILSFGLAYQPIVNIVIKADFEDWKDGTDRFNLLLGYVF